MSRIGQAASLPGRELRQLVLAQLPVGTQVDDAPSPLEESVGDEAAVALGPVGLGAHDRAPAGLAALWTRRGLGRELLELRDAGCEGVARHVIGVTAEGLVLPAVVG